MMNEMEILKVCLKIFSPLSLPGTEENNDKSFQKQ
jgi:hypothetical protein